MALILASGSMVGGGLLLGPYGVFAGLSFFGAIRNTARASKLWSNAEVSARTEAGHSAVMGAISAAIGVALTHQAFKSRRERQETA